VGGLKDESSTIKVGGLVGGGIAIGSWPLSRRVGWVDGTVQMTWNLEPEFWKDERAREKKSIRGLRDAIMGSRGVSGFGIIDYGRPTLI